MGHSLDCHNSDSSGGNRSHSTGTDGAINRKYLFKRRRSTLAINSKGEVSMSDKPQSQPQPIAPEEQYDSFNVIALLKTLSFFTPLILLMIIVMLALLGPSVGNIFSNITSSLYRKYGDETAELGAPT